MLQIFSYISLAFCVLFPIYFWSYALNFLSENDKSVRIKFWIGIFSWLFSVGATFIFSKFFASLNFLGIAILFLSLLGVLYIGIWILTLFGSVTARGFVRRVSFLHLSAVVFLFFLLFLLIKFLPDSWLLAGILITIFLPAFFEEISKHFSLLGLLGKKFSFSLADLTVFSFCVVLGFVFVENILYFLKFWPSIWLSISRTIFAFATHLLSALIAMLAWWKALSYPLASLRYFAYFSSGFFLATLLHFLYNYSLSSSSTLLLVPYSIAAYGLFVYLIKK